MDIFTIEQVRLQILKSSQQLSLDMPLNFRRELCERIEPLLCINIPLIPEIEFTYSIENYKYSSARHKKEIQYYRLDGEKVIEISGWKFRLVILTIHDSKRIYRILKNLDSGKISDADTMRAVVVIDEMPTKIRKK